MGQKVIWTERASQDLLRTISFIKGRWSDKEVHQFLFRTDRTARYLSQFPKMFKAVGTQGHRQANIDKYNALIYRILPECVEILSVWDMRQDPKNKPVKQALPVLPLNA